MNWDITNQQEVIFSISHPAGELVEAVRLTRLVCIQGAGLGEDGLVLNFLLVLGVQVIMIKHPFFLRVKVILLVCAAVELLTLCSWWAVRIYAYRKVKIVTQQALLSVDYCEDYVSCSQLHVNKRLERYLYPRIRLLGVSSQPQTGSWKYFLREIVSEGQSGLMNEYC